MKRSLKIVVAASVLALTGGLGWGGWILTSPSVEPFKGLMLRPSKGSPDLDVRFFGTSTISFDDGTTAIMEDGFFSRPGIWPVLTSKIAPNEERIDESLRKGDIHRLAAIFVAHSHYDHVLDTGTVALKTGATVLGTASTANAVRGDGLPENRIRIIKDGDTFTYGRFKVTAFETPHSPNPTSVGVIDHPLRTPAKEGDFKVGGNFSYLLEHGRRRILIVASGNYVPGKFKNVRADVVFLGIATLGKQSERFVDEYWHEAVQQTGAKLVIPIHWDSFFEPLSKPFTALPREMDAFPDSMKVLIPLARRDGVKLRLPIPYTPIDLDQ